MPCGIHFDCPEGHEGCDHAIPFAPRLDGSPATSWYTSSAIWQRSGETFETLVLSPSIRRTPAADVQPGDPPSFRCAFHGFIGGSNGQMPGQIEFCGDSR